MWKILTERTSHFKSIRKVLNAKLSELQKVKESWTWKRLTELVSSRYGRSWMWKILTERTSCFKSIQKVLNVESERKMEGRRVVNVEKTDWPRFKSIWKVLKISYSNQLFAFGGNEERMYSYVWIVNVTCYINPFTPPMFIWTWENLFSKMNIKPKQTIQYIQTFFEHVLYIFGKNAVSVYQCWRDQNCVEGSQIHAIFHRWRNFEAILVVSKQIFFLVPQIPNLKLSQYLIDMYRKTCGWFWVDTYLGIVKPF